MRLSHWCQGTKMPLQGPRRNRTCTEDKAERKPSPSVWAATSTLIDNQAQVTGTDGFPFPCGSLLIYQSGDCLCAFEGERRGMLSWAQNLNHSLHINPFIRQSMCTHFYEFTPVVFDSSSFMWSSLVFEPPSSFFFFSSHPLLLLPLFSKLIFIGTGCLFVKSVCRNSQCGVPGL